MTNRTDALSHALNALADTLAQIADADDGGSESPAVRAAARDGADAARRGATLAERGNATDAAQEAGDAMTHVTNVITYADDTERANLAGAGLSEQISIVGVRARRVLADAVAAYGERATGTGTHKADRLWNALTYGRPVAIEGAAADAGALRVDDGAITDRLPLLARHAYRIAHGMRSADA